MDINELPKEVLDAAKEIVAEYMKKGKNKNEIKAMMAPRIMTNVVISCGAFVSSEELYEIFIKVCTNIYNDVDVAFEANKN